MWNFIWTILKIVGFVLVILFVIGAYLSIKESNKKNR
jgi:glucose uptake protein GlcU